MLLPGSAPAQPVTPAFICHYAAAAAEREAGVPSGLLDAIGQIETGHMDREQLSSAGGQLVAWPWSVNAGGQGRRFDSLAEAATYVRERQRAGVQSIDVGCFQINLMYHPDAFTTLEEAFDPAANAAYAARFLAALHRRSGGWEVAVALYHSATPALGDPYRAQVLARWINAGLIASSDLAPYPEPDPVVIRLLRLSSIGVRVWTPGLATGAQGGPRLPRVVTLPP